MKFSKIEIAKISNESKKEVLGERLRYLNVLGLEYKEFLVRVAKALADFEVESLELNLVTEEEDASLVTFSTAETSIGKVMNISNFPVKEKEAKEEKVKKEPNLKTDSEKEDDDDSETNEFINKFLKNMKDIQDLKKVDDLLKNLIDYIKEEKQDNSDWEKGLSDFLSLYIEEPKVHKLCVKKSDTEFKVFECVVICDVKDGYLRFCGNTDEGEQYPVQVLLDDIKSLGSAKLQARNTETDEKITMDMPLMCVK